MKSDIEELPLGININIIKLKKKIMPKIAKNVSILMHN